MLEQETVRILVVDDGPAGLRGVQRQLESSYRCEVSSSVGEARRKLAAEPFDLVLCDVHLAGRAGLTLAEEILSDFPRTAVVVTTMDDDPDVARRAFESGVHGYLVKPFARGQLLVTTMNALRRRELELAREGDGRAGRLRELAQAQAQAIQDLRASRLETVERLAKALELHDPNLGRHVDRMAAITAFLAGLLGLDEERVALLRAAAVMHDVGKIGLPADIVRKTEALTSSERKVMERHTELGHELLSGSASELLRLAATVALTHHERFDGSGYPRGLAGDEIPIEGRLAAVADVFDALLSDRTYRPALTVAEAAELIRDGSGSHFDPEIVDLLLEHLDGALALRGAD